MTKAWDSGVCTTCEKSLVGVDSAILDSGCYCPDCVQPKYQWFVVEYNLANGMPQKLIGGFPTHADAITYAKSFCGHIYDWKVIQITPPDFS